MSKTIWYINHHGGGPGINPAYRAYELAREWQNQGHNAHVFIGSYTGPHQEQPHPRYKIINNVPYMAIPTTKYKASGLDRLMSMFLFAWRTNFIPQHLPKQTPQPDAIIISTVHPFGIFAGRRLAKKYKAKLVFEIRDFWPLTFIELLKIPRWHPFIILCALTERYAFKHADLVTSVLPRAHLYFEDFGFKVKNYAWTPMGVSQNLATVDITNKTATRNFREAKQFMESSHSNNKAVVIYAGAIGPPNNVESLFSALEYGKEKPEGSQISVLIIGDGVEREKLERQARGMENIDIQFTGTLSKDEAQALLNDADIGYAGGNNIPKLYRYGIAFNKIASYLGAGLVVLLPMEPCGDPVSESGCGIATGTKSSEELWGFLEMLIKIGPVGRGDMGKKGHKHLVRTHSYPVIAKEYITAIFGDKS